MALDSTTIYVVDVDHGVTEESLLRNLQLTRTNAKAVLADSKRQVFEVTLPAEEVNALRQRLAFTDSPRILSEEDSQQYKEGNTAETVE